MLGVWTEPETVGVYGVAVRIAALTIFILVAVNSVIAPRFASFHANGNSQALEQLAQRSAAWMLIAVSPVVLFILLFPDLILQLFGNEFVGGSWVLRILAIGQLVNVAVGSVGLLLMMTGNERVVRNNTVFAVTVNLIGNFCLVPILGALGAALSTAFALIVQNLVLYWKVKKILDINTLIFLR